MITNLDFAVLNAVQTLRSGFLDVLMIIITYLGSSGLIWIIPALVLLCRKSIRRHGAVILLAMGIALLFGNFILKSIVMRPRPFAFPQALLSADSLAIAKPMGRWSFPSSHTATAFAAATSIFLAHRKCGIAALVTAAAIGFSRIYLYVHFPTDVIAGAVLGVLCAFMAEFVINRLYGVKNKSGASSD